MPFEPIAQDYSQTPLSAQLARLLFLQGASLIHMMRWQSGYCSGLQPRVPPVRVRNASPFSQRSWIPFEPTAKGYTQHPLANHLLVPLLQSGPKSPPTCSRVGLAWVRRATSPTLLKRRSASFGGSWFNRGQPMTYPKFFQNLRSVAQAEATGGVTPFSNSDPLSGNGPPGYWLLRTCKLRVSNPAAATIL